jgi:hypothetical protein
MPLKITTMALISKAELAKARKAGFKRKPPKKPKRSASLSSLENYLLRCREFNAQAKLKIREHSKKESLRKKIFHY